MTARRGLGCPQYWELGVKAALPAPPQTPKYWWRFDRVDVGKIALRLVAGQQTEDKISVTADAARGIYSRRRHIFHHSLRYPDKRSPCTRRERSTDSVMAFQSRSEPFIAILMVIKKIESCQYSLTYYAMVYHGL